jgi:NAD-dependent SIR2 family protein deacetylase
MKPTKQSMDDCLEQINKIKEAINEADKIVIGAGAGLSTSGGLSYTGERFTKNFADFIEKYRFRDMYSATFYPYQSLEEYWAYMSRHIDINRYSPPVGKPYHKLLDLLKDKNYFAITTNVDHQFQRAGFNKQCLFYTQGDYGLFQCSIPCHNQTYDNEKEVMEMLTEQGDLRIPIKLIPHCQKCGKPMSMNLRCDDTFVQDNGWHEASNRYKDFISRIKNENVLFLELGVGFNTPVIIRFPFERMTAMLENAMLIRININQADVSPEIADKSICIEGDIADILDKAI